MHFFVKFLYFHKYNAILNPMLPTFSYLVCPESTILKIPVTGITQSRAEDVNCTPL